MAEGKLKYGKLVKRLRGWPRVCVQYDGSADQLHDEAADAIEELQKILDGVSADNDSLCEKLNESHNEGFDVGYWAGRRDYAPKWIPVTERMPENGEYVLCFCRANIVCVLRRDKDGDWYENPTHVYMSGFVTHWMPLPEPPKEES